jgi:cbb3-type cytochrome oxidase cytochrome c subunit
VARVAAVRVLGAAAAFCAATLAPAQEHRPGLAVTWQSAIGPEVHTEGLRLLSLHVERGESPTPFLPPGMFRARFEGLLPVPMRDRYRFQILGKGTVRLRINGEVVLEQLLRPGRAVESEPVRLRKGDNEIRLELESTALGEATLRLQWSGPEFGWEPVAPELWRCGDDAGLQRGDLLREGHRLFVERRCAHCHQTSRDRALSAFGELQHPGPDLRAAGARLGQAWTLKWLVMPRRMRADARMPALPGIGEREAADIAAFLAGLGEPAPRPAFSAEQAASGAERFRELGCVACHVTARGGDDDRLSLADVPAKWRGAALVAFLKDPRAVHPEPRMPDFALSDADATALAAFLLGAEGDPDRALPGDAAAGRELVAQRGCVRCHALEVADAASFAPLGTLDGARGCLAAEPADAPDHGLSDRQRDALRAFLPHAQEAPFRRAPADFAARQVESLRCTACHALDGAPSTWARIARTPGGGPPPPEEDPVAQGVPALTWLGGKLRPGWMERFITGREPSPRPWLAARMPRFGSAGADLVRGLARQHGYPDADPAEERADDLLARAGARLVRMGDGFACVQCHAIGDQPAVQAFEREGIDLRRSAARLRHDYYTRWLLDPRRIDPDSRMQKYADANGRTAFTDVLDGDARRQFEAIWHYILSLR